MNDQPLTEGRTDRWMDTQKFREYKIIPRHFLWRGIKTHMLYNLCPLTSISMYGDKIIHSYYNIG